MEIKQPLSPDANSWLIQYIVRYFKSVEIQPGTNLWDELVLYFKPDNNECDYLYNETSDQNVLYPVLSYEEKSHKVVLLDFEWVSPPIFDLKTGDYLDTKNELEHKNVDSSNAQSVEEQHNFVQEDNKTKLGFFARLLNFFRKQPQPIETVKVSMDSIPKMKYDEMRFFDINKAAQELVNFNGLEFYEAKEILLAASYNRKASRRLFIYNLEYDRELGLKALKVEFDLSFLFNSGFLNSEATKDFKKKLGNSHKIELEFEIQSPEIVVDPALVQTQLIKISNESF